MLLPQSKWSALATSSAMQKQYAESVSVVGEVARAAICAAPGHRLIAADFSGVESRVLALAGRRAGEDQIYGRI